MLDCEERFVGTNRLRPDSDADGFVDTNELLYGTNPATNDIRADLDFDAASNGDELRGHSDPAVNDAARRGAISYRYEIQEKDLEDLEPGDPRIADLEAGRPCYETRVSNITLADTEGDGTNRVYLYAVQAPFDDPTDFGVVRIACVEQRFALPDFRSPPYAEVELFEGDFVRIEDFDPDRDCTTGQPVF